MKQKKEPKEIKISQNYFINQINITNLKNRLIKQKKNNKKDGSESYEKHSSSNFEEKFENQNSKNEDISKEISEINVKLESDSEVEKSDRLEELEKLEIIDSKNTENFYFTSSNLNNNRLKNIFRSGNFLLIFNQKYRKKSTG